MGLEQKAYPKLQSEFRNRKIIDLTGIGRNKKEELPDGKQKSHTVIFILSIHASSRTV